MQPTHTIRFLSANPKEQSELFARVAGDLFFALGYIDLHRSMDESGREIELYGKSMDERRMRARCKDYPVQVGVGDIASFAQATSHEQQATESLGIVTKYFLALGGFAAGLGEVEQDVRLLDAAGVIKALEVHKLLVTDEKAIKEAEQCQQREGQQGLQVEGSELLVHKIGYVKALYFTQDGERTHVALIHSDEKPLSAELAMQVLESDRLQGGELAQLSFLSPMFSEVNSGGIEKEAMQSYRRWVARVCGIITLAGLPLDEGLASKKLKLEKLFVPLRATVKADAFYTRESNSTKVIDAETSVLGDVLTDHPHLALLAAPGGGKSTVLKRLATAYAFGDRFAEVEDNLPQNELLPLFIRCRDLKEEAKTPILLLLGNIAKKIELPQHEQHVFSTMVYNAVQEGRALLLIDGLDEITDKSLRETFARNVRWFLISYPQVRLVVTSRAEGFRLVAGVIAQVCREAGIAPFNAEDIRKLCERWHIEVDDTTPQGLQDARTLAERICKKKSIFILAQNPLLLTTLLIVKRNVGELPTRRAELYDKAVEILIRTWNVEGYPPMEVGETLAQLCYVACYMTEHGMTRIGKDDLIRLLQQARKKLDNELQHVKLPLEEFVETVEYRTSLLMQTGHNVKADWQLEPVYEFRHLTFQEFLTAYGYVRDLHEHRDLERPLADLLADHFHEDNWQEVIPLAVVLAGGRAAEATVRKLIALVEAAEMRSQAAYSYAALLGQCLLDEPVISRETFRRGVQQVARFADRQEVRELLLALQQSVRIGARAVEVLEESFAGEESGWEEYALASQEIAFSKIFGHERVTYIPGPDFLQQLATLGETIALVDVKAQIGAAFTFAGLSWQVQLAGKQKVAEYATQVLPKQAQQLMDYLTAMIRSGHAPSIFAACVALEADGKGARLLRSAPVDASFVMLLFHAWINARQGSLLVDWITKTLTACAPLQRTLLQGTEEVEADAINFLHEQIDEVTKVTAAPAAKAAALMGWYWQKPWSDGQLAPIIGEVYQFIEPTSSPFRLTSLEVSRVTEMLLALGTEGQKVLRERTQNLAKSAS